MADGLLQRFSTLSGGSSSSGSSTVGPSLDVAAGISQRIHHEPAASIKYPVYGPGSGPDIYDYEGAEEWPEAGGFFPGFSFGQVPPFAVQPGPPPPPPPPPIFRTPFAKFGKGIRFKGASVAVLTLLAFLFFLNVLQNYMRDYATTSQPTVILLSSGATKENLQLYPFRQKQNHDLGQGGTGSDPDDDADDNGHRPSSGYRTKRIRKGIGHDRSKHPKPSADVGPLPPPYGDLLQVNGL